MPAARSGQVTGSQPTAGGSFVCTRFAAYPSGRRLPRAPRGVMPVSEGGIRCTILTMGAKGIKKRKRRKAASRSDAPGVLEDLNDQAEWSSYGAHIPRPGNTARQANWMQRGWRGGRNAHLRAIVVFVTAAFLLALLGWGIAALIRG
jgi:hypothetical protein